MNFNRLSTIVKLHKQEFLGRKVVKCNLKLSWSNTKFVGNFLIKCYIVGFEVLSRYSGLQGSECMFCELSVSNLHKCGFTKMEYF
jgi:hypothetical protein